jgi:hypothetical protein
VLFSFLREWGFCDGTLSYHPPLSDDAHRRIPSP